MQQRHPARERGLRVRAARVGESHRSEVAGVLVLLGGQRCNHKRSDNENRNPLNHVNL
jgi:hypothetical protein